jgi:tetratricopeptide (TPR) repeat protein
LMAKPMVITLPFVLFLLDYWPLERTALNGVESGAATSNGVPRVTLLRLLLEKIPLLFLSAGSAWITLIAQRPAKRTLAELPFGIRIENAVVSYGLYLWKMLWPARLSFYPHSVAALPAWQWILSALVLTSVTVLVVIFRRKRYLPVGWFWFLGTLIPVIGLVQVGEYAMADRYAYVPLIGIFVMIAWSPADWAHSSKINGVWLVIPALCALMVLGFATSRQMSYWDSDYELWSHTLESAESPMAHNALGIALMHPDSEMTRQDSENIGTEQSRMEEARRHFERALELRRPQAQQNPSGYLPDIARTLNNLGNLDRLQNRMDEARQHCEGALEIYRQLAEQSPDEYARYLAATLSNLASLDRLQNRMGEARQRYEEALKIDRQLAGQSPAVYLPDLAVTLTEFARLNALQNRMEEARQHFEESLKIHRQLAEKDPAVYLPDVAMTLNNLGRVDRLQNRIEESRVHYTEAMTIYQKLAQSDPVRYAESVAQVEANLRELEKKSRAR